jgi:collagenase-like PrtC family protease
MTRQFTSYKLGCNFDPELISKVKALNDKYKDQGVQVDEFFGSDRDHAFLAARPDFRLPEVDKHQLEKYVRASLDAGINFNYTMNSINPGSKRELNEKQGEIKDYIKFLEGIGVHRITAANPIIFEFVRDVSSTMKLEVSTIMHVDTVTQIKYLKDTFNIDKVCGNLLKNRNKRFLKQATDYCNANDVKYEIMVNEFCGVGTDTATTHCSLRDSCYIAHSSDVTKEDAMLLNTYPMKHCIWARKTDVTSWLKLRFVRPEDIYRYEDLGVYNFKITGRTGTTKYIETMAEAYLSRSWEGNLLQLWKPLETIYTEKDELSFEHNIDIPNKELNKFVGKWFAGEGFRCEEELCGETCHYCQDYFAKKFTDEDLDSPEAHKLGLEVITPKKVIKINAV